MHSTYKLVTFISTLCMVPIWNPVRKSFCLTTAINTQSNDIMSGPKPVHISGVYVSNATFHQFHVHLHHQHCFIRVTFTTIAAHEPGWKTVCDQLNVFFRLVKTSSNYKNYNTTGQRSRWRGQLHNEPHVTDFLLRHITTTARTGRRIEQPSSDEGLWQR